MSGAAARLFAFLAGADFYRELHLEAVSRIEGGGTWLDVGCGPGLLTRIAAERGFQALGVDRDRDQIALARRLARRSDSSAQFREGDGLAASADRFDVVSAASWLAVVADPWRALASLKAKLAPGGVLLIIEPTARMTRRNAFDLWRAGRLGRRGYMALAWANARQGRTLAADVFDDPESRRETFPLLHGLVEAILLRRAD